MFGIQFLGGLNQISLKYIKLFLILAILGIPPWFEFRKHISFNKKEFVLAPLFALYVVGTYYTQNIVPFIITVATLYMVYTQRADDEEIYYLRPLGKNLGRVFLSTICFKIVITFINSIYIKIFLNYGVKLSQQEVTKVLFNEGWLQLLVLLPVIVIVAPVLEEYIFRHILYRKLSLKTGKIIAAVVTSLLFMLLHFNVAGAISFFGVGIYNCYLYEKYGYRACVMNHFMFNFVSVVFMIIFKIAGVDINTAALIY